MKYLLRILIAEARKQHHIYFHGPVIYFSMFLWPVLDILTAIYMFKPFTADASNNEILKQYLGGKSIEMFLIVGYLGYNFFYCLVQSAWHFSYERSQGTLELILLTPANRFAVILGNAVSSLFESIWLILAFASAAFFLLLSELGNINAVVLVLGLVVMTVAAVAWGTLLNSLFLLTRDAGFFYTLLQDPFSFLSGVRFPVSLFAPWLRAISYVMPLTYCLIILRKGVLQHAHLGDVYSELVNLAILTAILLSASYVLIGVSEKRAKRTGTLTLF